MKKYIVEEQVKCGCVIYAVINTTTGIMSNYYKTEEDAKDFASRQNKSCLNDNEAIIRKDTVSDNYNIYTLITNSCACSFATYKEAMDEAKKYNLTIIALRGINRYVVIFQSSDNVEVPAGTFVTLDDATDFIEKCTEDKGLYDDSFGDDFFWYIVRDRTNNTQVFESNNYIY